MSKIHRSTSLSTALYAVIPTLIVSCSTDSGGGSAAVTSASVTSPSTSSSNSTDSIASTTVSTSPSSGSPTSSSSSAASNSSASSGTTPGNSTSNSAPSTPPTSSAESSDATSSQAEGSDLTGQGSDGSLSGDETSESNTQTNADSSSTDGSLPMNNPPKPSAGCNNGGGLNTLKSGGASVAGGLATSTRLSLGGRDYIIDIPADYDPTHPYRLIFSWHQAYGSANGNAIGQYPANQGNNFNAQNYAFFGLHREAMAANEPAIFIAPQGITDFPWEYDRDAALFDDLLALVDANLCIDDSRVFTTGFSFGAMMSHALSLGRQSKLRAAVTMAAANFNFTQPAGPRAPFAYFGITGMSDGTCPWIRNGNSTTEGGKYCVLQHAVDNGCTIPDNIATAMNGSKNHICYDFEGCDAGYPVKVCTFDGNHTPSAVADGVSGGDDGLNAFVPPLAWEFISQF